MALAAYGGLEAMNSAETKPKELRLGKPCAGKPLARFDEGEGAFAGDRFAALSTLQPQINSLESRLGAVSSNELLYPSWCSDPITQDKLSQVVVSVQYCRLKQRSALRG
jgi:hypothetical protein